MRADPRLAALWGFWLEDASGTTVRGNPGSAGDLQGANVGDPDARGRVWAEDGLVISVVVTMGADRDRAGDREQVLDQVVEALRVGTWEEFEALDGEIQSRPPTAVESPCPSDSGYTSGVEGNSRWVFQLAPNPYSSWGEWSTCSFDLTSGGGNGGSVLPPPLGELGRQRLRFRDRGRRGPTGDDAGHGDRRRREHAGRRARRRRAAPR
ncbi:hypothetical protein JKP75_18265 [Blastococcus sp. TML/M2B]|uniref:hypothetical protein n=1 Tax=Blastococcus sp. TML/M2B TaxID=2798727 RepID=UPI00190C914D|nr:hypothetical protein [Blastococcus sp. TML/M2B]MBN1094324.1 hypothetical protein [Blastococcus sp. TML/M2B]